MSTDLSAGTGSSRVTPAPGHDGRPPSRERPPGALLALGIAALFVLSVDAGLRVAENGFDLGSLARLGLVVGVLLAIVWLRRFEYFLLLVLVIRPVLDVAKSGGGIPVLPSALAGVLVLGVVLWLAGQAYAGTLRPVSLLGRLSLLLLSLMTVSAAFADDQIRSVLQVARLAAAVAVFLALEQLLTTTARRRRLVVACLLSTVIPIVIGAVQVLGAGGGKAEKGLSRLTGTFLHPNAYGFYLVLMLLVATAIYRHVSGWHRVLVAFVLVAGGAELLFTYSRGSWLAIVVGLLVIGAVQSRKLLVLMPVGLALVPLLFPSVLVRVSDLSQTTTTSGTPGNSLFWRLDHWITVLEGARGHELIGIGPGGSDVLGESVLPPHNDFLRMYVETGTFGFLTYLAVLASALFLCVRVLRRPGLQGLDRGLAVGTLACITAFSVGSIGGNLISQVVILLYLFSFLAVVSGLAHSTSRTPHPPRAVRDPQVRPLRSRAA